MENDAEMRDDGRVDYAVRGIKPMDFFKLGGLKETEEGAFTGDSVFVRRDMSFQGFLNHFYQKTCLFMSLFLGRSPIRYTASVAIVGGNVVGVCWLREPSDLVGIFVSPGYRRMGIGSALVADLVKRSDADMVVMHEEDNPSLKIFEKNGFKLDRRFCKMVRKRRSAAGGI